MSKQVTVDRLPPCDFPHDEPTEAEYDFKTGFGPWANGCEWHFMQYGGTLGTGRGQKLVVAS